MHLYIHSLFFCLLLCIGCNLHAQHISLGITPLAFLQRIPADKFSYANSMGAYIEVTGDSGYVHLQFRMDYVTASQNQQDFGMAGIAARSYALRWGKMGFSALVGFSLLFPFTDYLEVDSPPFSGRSASSLPTPIQLSLGIVSEWYTGHRFHPYLETVCINSIYTTQGKEGVVLAARLGVKLCF